MLYLVTSSEYCEEEDGQKGKYAIQLQVRGERQEYTVFRRKEMISRVPFADLSVECESIK